MKTKHFLFAIAIVSNFSLSAQPWQKGGNTNTPAPPTIGTLWPSSITILTNNTPRAIFTTGSALSSVTANYGDGLRILDPISGGLGHLDLFTSNSNGGNETHAKFGSSGQVSGQNNRFEFISTAAEGAYYSTWTGGRHRFDLGQTEYGRLGSNGNWRFGKNTSGPIFGGLDATRKVEIIDNAQQLRLSFGTTSASSFTDLFSNTNGNLLIQPSGSKVGINSTTNPTATLEINGDLRIRNVPSSTTSESLLVGQRESSTNGQDLNVRRIDFPNNANQYLNGNGDWATIPVPEGNGFVDCISPQNEGLLNSDSRINLNQMNLYFSSDNYTLNKNQVLIGYNCGTSSLIPAKLQVRQKYNDNVNISTTAASFVNFDNGNTTLRSYKGIYAESRGVPSAPNLNIDNIGGHFIGKNAMYNYGIKGEGSTTSLNTLNNFGGYFVGLNATKNNFGIKAVGLYGSFAFGGDFAANQGSSLNYGINVSAGGPNGTTIRAGYFSGVIEVNSVIYPSDIQFKENIENEKNALEKLSKLRPVSYNMKTNDFPQFHFTENIQHGFIIQDLEQYLPELVHQSIHPGEQDSLGNEIVAPTNYKALNYNGIISINTQAINELNQKVDKQTLSDQVLKTNVLPLTNSLEKVLAMNGISYNWNYSTYPEMNLDSNNHVGFIAQEINQIDARLTYLDANDLMHVEYDKVVPVLAESIQELNEIIEEKDSTITNQQTQISDLNTRLTLLENCLSALLPTLCTMNQEAIQQNNEQQQQNYEKSIDQFDNQTIRGALEIKLSDKNAIILSQNVPNPFAEMTTIRYTIPTTVKEAQIHFYTKTGVIINSVTISERGNGEIRVFAEDLSSGLYTYSLVADGKVVATKKMVKE